MSKLIFLFLLGSLSFSSFAQEVVEAPLDPAYKNLEHPKDDRDPRLKNLGTRSDLDTLIGYQTPVKSQGSRGTCSIFSSTALLESLLKKEGKVEGDIDLSEEWVEYVAMIGRTSDGYWSFRSWYNVARHGIPFERDWAYIGTNWKTAETTALATERCGSLTGNTQKSCLLGHRNPNLLAASNRDLLDSTSALYDEEFKTIRDSARKNRRDLVDGFISATSSSSWNYAVYNVSDVRRLLDRNIPMTLSIDFYYGAWNHRKMTELGMTRDMTNWNGGIVGYPEVGSVDREKSRESDYRAGHSVVIVGYDDNKIVTTKQLMKDGTTKEFTYKGVYYFKNSWGTGSFGSNMVINGKSRAGYGMITQKHAHEQGAFYRLPTQ